MDDKFLSLDCLAAVLISKSLHSTPSPVIQGLTRQISSLSILASVPEVGKEQKKRKEKEKKTPPIST
jgi:hypothetical protein